MIQIYCHWTKTIKLKCGNNYENFFFLYVCVGRRYFGPAYFEICQVSFSNLLRTESFPLSSCSCKLCDLRLRSSHFPESFPSLVLEWRGSSRTVRGRFVFSLGNEYGHKYIAMPTQIWNDLVFSRFPFSRFHLLYYIQKFLCGMLGPRQPDDHLK
jgi:hypothetical protein